MSEYLCRRYGWEQGSVVDYATEAASQGCVYLEGIFSPAEPVRRSTSWQEVFEGYCDGALEARGDRWTEPGFFQSYVPYTMSEWIHDSEMTLVKNPFWPGPDNIPQPKIDEVHFVMLDETAAFAEYEAGNIDATAVPLADIDRVKADPVLSQELVIAPVLCTYYYGFNTTAKAGVPSTDSGDFIKN